MGHTLSHREVKETLEENDRLIESADAEARKLREERARSTRILERARKSFNRLARRNRTAA